MTSPITLWLSDRLAWPCVSLHAVGPVCHQSFCWTPAPDTSRCCQSCVPSFHVCHLLYRRRGVSRDAGRTHRRCVGPFDTQLPDAATVVLRRRDCASVESGKQIAAPEYVHRGKRWASPGFLWWLYFVLLCLQVSLGCLQ